MQQLQAKGLELLPQGMESREGMTAVDLDYVVVLEVPGGVHVLLEVKVEVLEDKVYALLVVHHILQPVKQQQSASPSIS